MQFEQEKDLLFEIRGGKEQAEGDVGELDDVANKKQRSLRKLDNKTKTANIYSGICIYVYIIHIHIVLKTYRFGNKQIWEHVLNPFYDAGPNDKGIGIQLGYSILRVLIGFGFAVVIAIPLGFLIGMSPLFYKALDPFIQIMKPVSPLAWMPLALYTIKDSVISSVFVIFICSVWPMLANTAFGVASVRKEWLNVAKTLEVGHLRTAFRVILPAAAPTILTGMRISIGIAWLVIVAAEMLVGGTGIGYFVWNEWNNLSITNVIASIFFIGLIGMMLDMVLSYLTRLVTYAE
mgnify:CR=1 FL=1